MNAEEWAELDRLTKQAHGWFIDRGMDGCAGATMGSLIAITVGKVLSRDEVNAADAEMTDRKIQDAQDQQAEILDDSDPTLSEVVR